MAQLTAPGERAHWGLDWKAGVAVAALLVAAQALILRLHGHIWICECGYVKLWHGVVVSSENSQHLADWYTFSHVIHGFLFYLLFWLLFRRSTIWTRLSLAILLEAAWEILENSPSHHQPLSRGDHLARLFRRLDHQLGLRHAVDGARLLPRRAPAGLADGDARHPVRAGVGWLIRDNLTLNVLMLVYPLDSVKAWQGGL